MDPWAPLPAEPLTGVAASRFGLYVHFPWCRQRCPYCDFAVTVAPAIPHEAYLEGLLAELELRLSLTPSLAGRSLDSLFIGGGTPSLWEPAMAARLLEAVHARLPIAAGAEVALEANPGPEDAARFADFRAAGFNRISLGVQSFTPRTLTALGRSHTPDEAREAVRAAKAAGFPSVSLDLIYGVHGQSVEDWRADVGWALELETPHLSAYALTLEREALAVEVPLARQLARGEVTLPPDQAIVEMAHLLEDALGGAGLRRYEVSNFAREGYHSRHNALYWTGGEYLALGAGATGFLLDAPLPRGQHGTGVLPGVRYENLRSAPRYLAATREGRLPEQGREALTPAERFEERLSLGLRLRQGVALAPLFEAAGEDLSRRASVLRLFAREGLLEEADGRTRLTRRGLDVHGAICARLI